MSNEKRFLKYHYPKIKNNEKLPVSYQYIQLYSIVSTDEQGVGKDVELPIKISVADYQIPEIELHPAFYKPISKCINCDDVE